MFIINKRLWIKRIGATAIDIAIPFSVATFYWWEFFISKYYFVAIPIGEAWASTFLYCTLPFMLSSLLLEISPFRRTFGKLVFRIKVHSLTGIGPIFLRNILKWLAIELCVGLMHISSYYVDVWPYTNLAAWYLGQVPVMFMAYTLSDIVMNSGDESWYDRLTKTQVSPRKTFFSNTSLKLKA